MSECVVRISLPRANRVGFWRWDTTNFCYPPLNRAGFWRSRKISATTPPHWIGPASGDHGKFLLLPPPHWIGPASGDHGKVRLLPPSPHLLYNTNFSRGGNFRYIRELGFCAKLSSRENNIHCEWNFAKFSSREIYLPRNFPPRENKILIAV